ncbi:MAG: rod shape-determining protein MreD [Nitrospirota bacterium]|nr:rod shape-determining protein MreD [Nitrospirota bacterium]
MSYIFWAIIIVLIFIIQGKVSLFDVVPNFIFVVAYYAGIRGEKVYGTLLGSLIGAVQDSLSGIFLGPNLLSKGLVGYFSSCMSGSFFRWTPLLGIIGISILTVFDGTVVFLSRSIFERMPVSIGTALFMVTLQSLINAPLGLFLKPRAIHHGSEGQK